jgi:hypothetical protein
MHARLIQCLLGSACVHLALLGMLWREAAPGEGFAHGKAGAPGHRALTVRLVKADAGLLPSGEVHALALNALGAPDKGREIADTAIPLPQIARDDYYSVGQLTRLPVPVAPIDLNESAFNGSGFAGTIELTILILANGLVSEVVTSSENDDARTFAELVAARFRNARFVPGEINGTAVNSRLRVTVVSDPLLAPGERE